MDFDRISSNRHVRTALLLSVSLTVILSISACHVSPATPPLQKSLPAILLTLGVAETVAAPSEFVPMDAVTEDAEELVTADDATASTQAAVDAATPAEVADEETLPAEIAQLLESANPEAGEQLTVAFACVVCHPLADEPVPTGSSWHNIGALAATRVEGQSAETYLYLSIVDPNIHIVEGSQPNVMPSTYKDILTPVQFADIIAYLLTIKAE